PSPQELQRAASHIEAVPGVTDVGPRLRTGSLVVKCEPAAQPRVLRALDEFSSNERRARPESRASPRPRHATPAPSETSPAPGLRLLGATAALGTSVLPVPGLVTVGLIVGSGLPTLLRAGRTIAAEGRVTVDALDAAALALLLARGRYRAAGLLTGLLALGQ